MQNLPCKLSVVQTRDLNLNIDCGHSTLGVQVISATLKKPMSNYNGTLLVCLAGGSYSRFYFQAEFEGYEGYNFADSMIEKGFAVLSLDHIGMGDSGKPKAVNLLNKSIIAAFNHATVETILDEFEDKPNLVGIGHSMGAMALIEQQAQYATFDKICILGWTNIGLSLDAANLETQLDEAHYASTDRNQMRPLFHLPDVPTDLIDQDNARASLTPSPFAQQALHPGIVADEASQITCPIFLAFGEVDISPNPNDEPNFYKNAKSINLKILAGSAHNHNFATSRTELWDEIHHFAAPNFYRKSA